MESRFGPFRAEQKTPKTLMMSSRDKHDKLWRASLSCLSRPADCEGWLHDEVDALVSRRVKESDLLRLPRKACFDQERWQSGGRHSGTQRLNGVWRADRRCLETRTATVKLARGRSKSRRLVLQVVAWCRLRHRAGWQKAPMSVSWRCKLTGAR